MARLRLGHNGQESSGPCSPPPRALPHLDVLRAPQGRVRQRAPCKDSPPHTERGGKAAEPLLPGGGGRSQGPTPPTPRRAVRSSPPRQRPPPPQVSLAPPLPSLPEEKAPVSPAPRSPPPGTCSLQAGPGRTGSVAAPLPLPPAGPARTLHPPPSWAPRAAAAASERPLRDVSAARGRPRPPHTPARTGARRAAGGPRGNARRRRGSAANIPALAHHPHPRGRPGPCRRPAPTCPSPCASGASVTRFVVATEILPTSPPTSPGLPRPPGQAGRSRGAGRGKPGGKRRGASSRSAEKFPLPGAVPAGHLFAPRCACTQPGRSGVLGPPEVVSRFTSYVFTRDLSLMASSLSEHSTEGAAWAEHCPVPQASPGGSPARRCHQEPSLAWVLPGRDSHTPYRRSQPMELLHIISLCVLFAETSARQLT